MPIGKPACRPCGSSSTGSLRKWLVLLLSLLILLPALLQLSAGLVQARYVLQRQTGFTISVPAASAP